MSFFVPSFELPQTLQQSLRIGYGNQQLSPVYIDHLPQANSDQDMAFLKGFKGFWSSRTLVEVAAEHHNEAAHGGEFPEEDRDEAHPASETEEEVDPAKDAGMIEADAEEEVAEEEDAEAENEEWEEQEEEQGENEDDSGDEDYIPEESKGKRAAKKASPTPSSTLSSVNELILDIWHPEEQREKYPVEMWNELDTRHDRLAPVKSMYGLSSTALQADMGFL